ncbi:CheY-like superfamily protein [Tanacetum coccineum]
MAPLVSTKFVLGLVACQVSYRVGPSSDLDTGSCTRAREVMMFCTIKSKPLALPWGRTPRLSSGVRVSTHVCQRMSECLVLGFPSISVTLVVVGVGPLSGKGPRIIVFADASVLPRITSLKCVLTQEHLNAVCAKYFVPEEVHPQLPNSDATMHERPAENSPMKPLSIEDSFNPHGLKVLVVDNDPGSLLHLTEMLTSCQYQATTYSLPTEALALIKEDNNKFDIVVTEVYFSSDITGVEFLEIIVRKTELPVSTWDD